MENKKNFLCFFAIVMLSIPSLSVSMEAADEVMQRLLISIQPWIGQQLIATTFMEEIKERKENKNITTHCLDNLFVTFTPKNVIVFHHETNDQAIFDGDSFLAFLVASQIVETKTNPTVVDGSGKQEIVITGQTKNGVNKKNSRCSIIQ